ncbi:MAG: transporter [Woeseia sp.]
MREQTIRLYGVRALLGALACCVSTLTVAAPIATNTALPLGDKGVVLREQIMFMRASDTLLGSSREVERFELRTTVGYGLSRNLAVFAALPYADISSDISGNKSSAAGFGDAMMFARYEMYNVNRPAGTLRVAPYLGLRMPTGKEGETGDGSVDAFGGLVVTVASIDWELDSQIRYDLNRAADGFDRGNVVTLDSSLQYRLAPAAISAATEGFLFGVLELSASLAGKNETVGIEDPNSGGFQLFLTPGLAYATRRWMADFGVRVPVVNDLNGSALEPDLVVVTSVRFNF